MITSNAVRPTKAKVKKWVKTLRSGQYEQATNGLQSGPNKYCCLGVACKLFIPEKLQEKYADGRIQGGFPSQTSQRFSLKWLTMINSEYGRLNGVKLSTLNDIMSEEERYTFDEIADCLELEYVYGEFGEQN